MSPQIKKKTSLHHLISSICHILPRGVLAIEDIVIRDNRVIVRYKTERDRSDNELGFINNSRVVTVNSLDALRLYDGKVMEHRDTIYQIKTSLQHQKYS